MTSRPISSTLLTNVLAHYGLREKFNAVDGVFRRALSLSIDSRTLKPGEIFLAIRGDLDDGHKYIEDVLKKGAALIIADEANHHELSQFASSPIIFVKDTLKFFGDIAHAHLANLAVKKIGITGSNGKTTTKEMIKAALSHIVGKEKVYASVGNKNNLFGLPLCALEVNQSHQFAIFEMGMNQPGEMARLCAIVSPDVGVISNIGSAHAGNFANGVEGIRHEKGQLFKSILANDGHAVINLDDEQVIFLAEKLAFKSRTTFGWDEHASVRIMDHTPYSLALGAQTVTLMVDNQETIEVLVPLAGAHHAHNAACALAVIKAMGLSVSDGASGLKDMAKITGRMSVNLTKDGHLVINDGYNANPQSMRAGIIASHQFPAKRRVAVVGAMGELGMHSDQHHFELGQLLATNFDQLFICGEAAQEAVTGAKQAGMDPKHIEYRCNSAEVIEPLRAYLRSGDLVFVKGSLSSNMQTVATALLSD